MTATSKIQASRQSTESQRSAARSLEAFRAVGPAWGDNRVEDPSDRKLAEDTKRSPFILQQKAFFNTAQASALSITQRKTLQSAFAAAAHSCEPDCLSRETETAGLLKPLTAGREPAQRVTIKGTAMTYPEIASVIKDVSLSKGVKQAFLTAMVNDASAFDDSGGAHAYILAKAQALGKPVDHEEIARRGAATEEAAASIIGGKVNRGANGKDVEWRLIDRGDAEKIK